MCERHDVWRTITKGWKVIDVSYAEWRSPVFRTIWRPGKWRTDHNMHGYCFFSNKQDCKKYMDYLNDVCGGVGVYKMVKVKVSGRCQRATNFGGYGFWLALRMVVVGG